MIYSIHGMVRTAVNQQVQRLQEFLNLALHKSSLLLRKLPQHKILQVDLRRVPRTDPDPKANKIATEMLNDAG